MTQEGITIKITRTLLRSLLLGAVGLFLLWLVLFNWIPRARYANKAAQAKQNLHAIQLALERFAVDSEDSRYPSHPDELLQKGYLSEWPINPFTGQAMHPLQADLHAYDGQGWLNIPNAKHGDFVYYPRYAEGGFGKPVGYTLFLY